MRVVLLSPYTEPVKGGISSYCREVVDAYRSMGLNTIGLAVVGESNSRLTVLGPSRIGFVFRASLCLLTTRPAVVHAHSHWHVLLPGLILKLIDPKTRVLFTLHTMPEVTRKRVASTFLSWMLRHCDAVTFVSRQLQEAVHLPAEIKQEVVHPAPEEDVLRRATRGGVSQPIVLFVGPLVWPEKVRGVVLLVEGFALVAPAFPEWRLVIVGDGPLRTTVERKVADLGLRDRVWFKGTIDNVSDEFVAAEVYAHISLQEGLPLAILDAMALGRPVVATHVGGIPEVISNGNTGVLVAPTAAAVAQALRMLLGDEPFRRRLGDAAREWISNDLSWGRVAATHVRLALGA